MSTTEDQIVQWFMAQRRLPADRFPIGIGDDMAQVRLAGGGSVCITTDMLLEGVHFDLSTATLDQVGYKSMACSLSDCAAMASRPLAAVAAVAMPKAFGESDLKQLHAGILRAADRFDCPLVGGDMTRWEASAGLVVNVAMLSEHTCQAPIQRFGAQVGDWICVTGTLGGSLAGRHLEFEPRIEEAIRIASRVRIHAMMDLSDGLSTDLRRICRLSRVGAMVEAAKIPCSDQAKRTGDPLGAALNDGEDFELLFTLGPDDGRQLLESWDMTVPITPIGVITDAPDLLQIKDLQGQARPLVSGGYDHFRD